MSQKKPDLTRIRDSQHRSRVARKEYLQELEARLRQLEAQGLEVPRGIHLAARGVAEENKILRRLLAQLGVGDDVIEAYLQSNPMYEIRARAGGQLNAAGSLATFQTSEELQNIWKQCNGDSSTSVPTSVHNSYQHCKLHK